LYVLKEYFMFRRGEMLKNKIFKKKSQMITDEDPKNIERRALLAQASRVIAGTIGSFALISMSKIDSVLGQDKAAKKSIRRKVQKTLLKTFKDRDIVTKVLASQQIMGDVKATWECAVLCECPCSCPPETSYSTHTTNQSPVFSQNVGPAIDRDKPKSVPTVTGVGLGIMAVGLGAAGAWHALKERVAQKDKI
jgi:hypothetical protein